VSFNLEAFSVDTCYLLNPTSFVYMNVIYNKIPDREDLDKVEIERILLCKEGKRYLPTRIIDKNILEKEKIVPENVFFPFGCDYEVVVNYIYSKREKKSSYRFKYIAGKEYLLNLPGD
jgi:hypothetical protein